MREPWRLLHCGGCDNKRDFQYKLEKRGGRWLIVESTVKRM
jgi:hypothetical protein